MTRNTTTLALLSLAAAAGSACAQAVFVNPWDSGASDGGSFSDPGQVLAGEFDLAAPAGVTAASWHGTMYDPFSSDPLDTGDTWSFDVVFRYDSGSGPGAEFARRSVVAAVTDTGINIGNERAYAFDVSFAPVSLAGNTTYFFTALNTGTPRTFRWNWGTDTNYDGWINPGGNSAWRVMGPTPLNFTLSVPAPGSAALLGLGALASVRRGRR